VMVHRVFEFGNRLAREVMIPRPEVVAMERGATIGDLLTLFAQHTHARFPVYEQDLDNVVGFVSIKDVLKALAAGAGRSDGIASMVRPAFAVPETRRVDSLFVEMQDRDVQMAVVIDEYGGTAGIVTLEELVEEVVGRVGDELMPGRPLYRRTDERTLEVDAGMRIDELKEELDIELPDHPDYETVAGFVLFQLGRIPEAGDRFRYSDLEITVVEMRGPKIETLRLTRL